MEPLGCDDIDMAAEEILQILLQTREVEQREPGRWLNEQVEITLQPGLAARNRAEEANIRNAVRPREA